MPGPLQQTMARFVSPRDQTIAALEAQLQQPIDPMYSEEEAQRRRAGNQRQYEMGMLGMLSGDEALGGVGGKVLKQALAARQPRVTERGVADPITGRFQYDPGYLRQQLQERLHREIGARSNEQFQDQIARQAAAERAQLAADRDARDATLRRELKSMGGGEPLKAVMTPDGPRLYPQSMAAFMQPAPTGGGNASEDERKAAGWLGQARQAFTEMQTIGLLSPDAQMPTLNEKLIGAVPGVGADLAYARMPEERQRYIAAASAFSEAALRAATGAGINAWEAEQKVRSFTPQWGEKKETTAQKLRAAEQFLQDVEVRAGRALPKPPGAAAGYPAPQAPPGALAAPGGPSGGPGGAVPQPPAGGAPAQGRIKVRL